MAAIVPSGEQRNISDAVNNGGRNVAGLAVAGSGKTTQIMLIGKEQPSNGKSLVLTYNSKLKEETRERALRLGLSGQLEIHSFHALGVKYYHQRCFRDNGLESVIDGSLLQSSRIPSYGVFILDEAQDMKELLFEFFLKVVHDTIRQGGYIKAPQIIFFGDERQSIYKFLHSDERYIMFAERIFEKTIFNNNAWRRMPLSTSFRISGNMATFVNTCMIRSKPDLIKAVKPSGHPVLYLIGGAYKAAKWLPLKIKHLHRQGIEYGEMIILTPSVTAAASNSKTPLAQLVNNLAEEHILVHKTDDSEMRVNADVAKGKLLLTTYHQSKGIERKVVIVFQFERSYFPFYVNRGGDTEPKISEYVCPNTLYVACTRAKEHLILVAEEYNNEHLPFLDRKRIQQLSDTCKVVQIINLHEEPKSFYKIRPAKSLDEPEAKEVLVTQLLQWLPERIAIQCKSKLHVQKLDTSRPELSIALPQTVSFTSITGEQYEEQVSDLNGLAIPAMFELQSNQQITMLREVEFVVAGVTEEEYRNDVVLRTIYRHFKSFRERVPVITTIAHCLELSCIYQAAVTNYINKLAQIQSYTWLDGHNIENSITFFSSLIKKPEDAKFEHVMKHQPERYQEIIVSGSADILTERTLFEVKCVSLVTDSHCIQLAMCAWLWGKCNTGTVPAQQQLEPQKQQATKPLTFHLIDVIKAEVWEITPLSDTSLDEIASTVITQYLTPPTYNMTDEAFITRAQALTQHYLGAEALANMRHNTLTIGPPPALSAEEIEQDKMFVVVDDYDKDVLPPTELSVSQSIETQNNCYDSCSSGSSEYSTSDWQYNDDYDCVNDDQQSYSTGYSVAGESGGGKEEGEVCEEWNNRDGPFSRKNSGDLTAVPPLAVTSVKRKVAVPEVVDLTQDCSDDEEVEFVGVVSMKNNTDGPFTKRQRGEY